MARLDQRDMAILHHYVEEQNRELYWNYLAQHEGNDGYGLLALGVVRNDSMPGAVANNFAQNHARSHDRSEEHTSELQSLMRISYAVFCLKKKTQQKNKATPRKTAFTNTKHKT